MVALPTEVQELAVKVSEQKQAEVNNVLNQIFSGTSDWEKQVDSIEVKSVSDKMSIQLADAARKNVKNARLAAEKVFDAKREEVQRIKSEYDLEDKLWLKAKQIMQLKFKAIEEKAEWKAKFVERYEAEQKELRTQVRIEKVMKYSPEVNRVEFENMSDEMFSIFLSGIEKAYNDKIESARKLEEERIAKEKAAELHNKRKEMLIPYWDFVPMEKRSVDLSTFTDNEFKERFDYCVDQKKKHDDEQLRIVAENQRLNAEREAKEKELEANKAKAEKAEKERKEAEALAAKAKAEADAKLKAEREAKEKLEKELLAKKQAEEKRLKEIADAERKQKEAEAKAAKAPKKQKLTVWIDGFIIGIPAGMESDETVKEIVEKFNGFKSWAKSKIESL